MKTSLVTWAHQHNLLILAWTVNDAQRASQLIRLGADGDFNGARVINAPCNGSISQRWFF